MRRDAPFSVRLTPEERQRLEAQAGSMPLASYIKSVVFADEAPKYRKRKELPPEDKQLLAEILARLGQRETAYNLDLIAKHLNQGTLVLDGQLETDLLTAIAEVAWIRTTLMQALGVKP